MPRDNVQAYHSQSLHQNPWRKKSFKVPPPPLPFSKKPKIFIHFLEWYITLTFGKTIRYVMFILLSAVLTGIRYTFDKPDWRAEPILPNASSKEKLSEFLSVRHRNIIDRAKHHILKSFLLFTLLKENEILKKEANKSKSSL